MNQKTEVKTIQIKPSAARMIEPPETLTELSPKKTGFGAAFLRMDTLIRNLAVAGGLALVLIAVRNSASPQAQSVFSALQEGAGMQWDESVGKLSFVNALLPKEIQEVWSESWPIEAVTPVDGEVIQAWTQNKPYLLISSKSGAVCAAADGEVMSVAHGMDEERIVRIRHDGYESVYGNLQYSLVEVGDTVCAGEQIGTLLSDQPLAFEMRQSGMPVDPAPYLN